MNPLNALELPDEQALTTSDLARLARLEIVIEDGLAPFVKVGDALLEIRSKRLYRESYETFENYCQERWSMNRDVADRTIRSAQVANELRPIGRMPANESQARELAPLLDEPKELKEAWVEVVELHETPTAADVKEVVDRRRRLTDEQRQEVVSRCLSGEKQKDVAAALGISQSRVSGLVRSSKEAAGATLTERRPAVTVETKIIKNIHDLVRKWTSESGDEWIHVSEAARRARVLTEVLSFLETKRDAYAKQGANLLKKGHR